MSTANKPVVSIALKTAFAGTDYGRGHARWRKITDALFPQLRNEVMDGS